MYGFGEQIQIGECTPYRQVYTAILYQSIKQCTQNIFECTVICDDVLSVIDLNNRYRMDSVLCLDQCTMQYIVSCFLTSYSRYFQCTVILYSQNMYRFAEQI